VKLSWTSLLAACLWPLGAWAQNATWFERSGELKQALEAHGDPARGEAAFAPCRACHRKDASGRAAGGYPRLAGQYGNIVIKQLVDIRSGRRSNPNMEPFVGPGVLSVAAIADIGAYLQSLPVPAGNGKGPGSGIEKGRQLFERDCVVCHGARGEGNAAQFYPMVAAQHYSYLLRETQLIRDGDSRDSNPDMVKVIKPYEMADLQAVSDYMASLPPPQ
jgi:cytochrome c553